MSGSLAAMRLNARNKTMEMIRLTSFTIRKAEDDPSLVLEELISSYKITMGQPTFTGVTLSI